MDKFPEQRLSIVVIELVGGAALKDCIDAVMGAEAEYIVVTRSAQPALERAFPNLTVMVCDAPLPQRRRRGFLQAKGEFVVMLEDSTRISAEHVQAGVDAAFRRPEVAAASGPVVVDAALKPRFQALGCTEYGRYHRQQVFAGDAASSVAVERLPGNLFCYRKQAVEELVQSATDGLIEANINDALIQAGGVLLMEIGLTNRYAVDDEWSARLRTRFHHGHLYSGQLAQSLSLPARAIQLIKALLLPLVLSLRAMGFMHRMEEINKPLQVVMWIFLLETFWSLGEVAGVLLGAPKSMGHWR